MPIIVDAKSRRKIYLSIIVNLQCSWRCARSTRGLCADLSRMVIHFCVVICPVHLDEFHTIRRTDCDFGWTSQRSAMQEMGQSSAQINSATSHINIAEAAHGPYLGLRNYVERFPMFAKCSQVCGKAPANLCSAAMRVGFDAYTAEPTREHCFCQGGGEHPGAEPGIKVKNKAPS